MLNLKSVIGASLFAISAMAASSAFAYGPAAGSYTAGPGATTLSYLGNNVPCTSTFTISIDGVSGHGGSVTNAVFATGSGGSALCPHITANALPWVLSAATATGTPGVYTATISGVSVTVPAPVNATCTGSVSVTLNNSTGQASFSGTLHNGAIPCGVSGTGLTTAITAP